MAMPAHQMPRDLDPGPSPVVAACLELGDPDPVVHNVHGEGCGNVRCAACHGLQVTTTDRGAALRRAAREQAAIQSLGAFIRWAWHLVEPSTPLAWGWHIDLIARELEGVTAGQWQKVLFAIPPGHMKSLIVSVFWPAWSWLHDPTWSAICLSNDDDLVKRDARRMRDIVESEEYRRLIRRAELVAGRDPAKPWGMAHDQNEKHYFANTKHGFRQSLSIGAKITGKRAQGLIIDDPYDAKEAIKGSPVQVARRMREVIDVYDQVLPSRVNNPRTAFEIVIMQRLNDGDLAGVLIERGEHRVVTLDSEYDPEWEHNHPDDPRSREGQPLFPAMYPRKVLRGLRKRMRDRAYGAQYRQRPTPDDGGLFLRSYMQHYQGDPLVIGATCDEVAITLDCAFKDNADSDYVVAQVWGRKGATYWLLDQVRGRMTLPATIPMLATLLAKWPRATTVLIEDKANGTGVIQFVQGRLPNVIPYSPRESKFARAQVAAIAYESGQVWLPDPKYAPWVGAYIEELIGFGAGAKNDDQVDATSQLLIRWTTQGAQNARARMAQEFGGL